VKLFVTPKKLLDRFIRDKKGHIAIWQFPNVPLLGWLVCRLATLVVAGSLEHTLKYVGTAFLLVWAYLEITQGASYFRRVVGLLVFIGTLVSNMN
jgi:hypothetical protein